jgi:metallo-beta-lactamase class B
MKITLFAALAATSALAFAQSSREAADKAMDDHIVKARNAAGFEFTDVLARLCVVPARFPETIRDAAPGPPPSRESWYIGPAKVFDNVYFVGSKIHNSWALVTSQGIIILDTLFTYNSEEEIVGGLQKLGLDPAQIKYVIITHAHGDHVGGAKLLQDRFHARIVMGGPDWEMIENSKNGYPAGKPKRDIVADDGQKITLGDETVTIVTTPGHTKGTLSMIFPVKDNGRTLTAVYSGGTAFNFPSNGPNFDIYIRSQAKIAAAAAAAGATVFMSNHTEFDGAVPKIKMLAARKPGEPHPFEIGQAAIARYFTVSTECAEAAKIRFAQ